MVIASSRLSTIIATAVQASITGWMPSGLASRAPAVGVPFYAEIDTAMNANLCRCGTYLRIREGIHHAVRSVSGPGAGEAK